MWLCNNNSELATLPWEKTGLGKIYKDIHSVVVSSWLNVHQFPIHDQPVRRAVIIATWIHDSISCVFHNDNQNISPFQIVFRLKMNELRNFSSTNGFWHCVQPVTLHAVCVLLSRDTSSISKQQADSSLKMLNDQLYMMFLPRFSHWINAGIW